MLRLALAGVAVLALAPVAHTARHRTVPCSEVIDHPRFPYRNSGYRTVLGAVSVPAAYLAQIENTGEPPFPWWRKAGLVIRANGTPVTITVPPGWRDRVAFEWGNAGTGGPFSSLSIAGCSSDP